MKLEIMMTDNTGSEKRPIPMWLVLLAAGAALVKLPIREARLPAKVSAA